MLVGNLKSCTNLVSHNLLIQGGHTWRAFIRVYTCFYTHNLLREGPSKDIELFTKICTKLPAFISSFGELLSWSTYASVYINSQNILKLSCFIMFMVCRLHMIKHFASHLNATTIIPSNELFFKGTIM